MSAAATHVATSTPPPDPSDLAFDAVIAAPAIFENDRLRVLEVTLLPDEEEPTHHHRWPSVFDQVQGPVHDMTPDGTMLPPKRDVMQAFEQWNGQGCMVVPASAGRRRLG